MPVVQTRAGGVCYESREVFYLDSMAARRDGTDVSVSVKRALNCAISGPRLRNAVEHGVSTHIWAKFYTNSTNLE
jgi:hypothetical protein